MTRTISDAERRAIEHENEARSSIEFADLALSKAEAEILTEVGADGVVSPVNQRLLRTYADGRYHLVRAAKVLAP